MSGRTFCRCLATLMFAPCVWAMLARPSCAQPAVTHASPLAVAPGKTTELTLQGSKLSAPLKLWSSFPAEVEWLPSEKSDGKQARCKVTLGSGIAAGIAGIAVASADGVSDVVYVMVDDLPSVADAGKNHDPAEAQQVALPIAIDGLSDGTLADFYRVSLDKGQTVTCEVVAARLGWDFDALVRVLDADGKELLLADDDPASGPDARLVFTAPHRGDYLLEVRDNRYKPGGRYRLRLGNFPLVSTTAPLVVQRGSLTGVDFLGPRVDSTQPMLLAAVSPTDRLASFSVSTRPLDAEGSAWSTLGLTELKVCREGTSGADAPKIVLPCVACGVLSNRGERDAYEFSATKATVVRLRAVTRSLGSPAVLALTVLDASGKQLAASAVSDNDEPVLNFTVPADGSYRLSVEDLAGRGGFDFSYAVECQTGPRFALVLKNDKATKLKYSLPAGGAFYLDVQCQRAGYDGPIRLSLDADQPAWQIINDTIAAKANEARVYVQPPPGLAAGDVTSLRIVGRGDGAGAALTASMTTTVSLRTSRPALPYPPAWHDGTIFVSSQGPKPGFFVVTSRENALQFDPDKGEGQLTVEMQRTNEKFKDTPLVIVPLGLPSGVTLEVKRSAPGTQETYDLVLKGLKSLPPGEHAFRYFAYAELAGQGRGVVSGDIRLVPKPSDKPSDPAPHENKAASQ